MYEPSPAAEPAAPAGSFYPHPGYALQAFHPYHRGPSPLSQQQVQQQHPAGAGQQVQIKGKRKRASPQQLEVLNKVFASTSFPSTEVRNSLAHELGMTPRTVQIWFQNKRQASRQRDGHHSRNTKSMATSAANMNSFDRQYSKSQSPADGASIPPPTAAAASISPFAASVPAPGPSPLARLPLPAAMADAAAAGPAARNARPVSWCVQTSSAADAYGRPGKARADTTASSRPEYAHTRNDQWFADDTPARLDYLYDHSSRVVLVSQHSRPKQLVADRMAAVAAAPASAPPKAVPGYLPAAASQRRRPHAVPYAGGSHALPPLSPPSPYSQTQSLSCVAGPARRTMSLMDLLNAPPEQRKLPPLPPVMP